VTELDSLTRVLQASISPVAMVSGVGLLLLSLTNRFGRVTDRLRKLTTERAPGGKAAEHVERQIQIFYSRARIIRSAISAAVGCMLFASFMVLLLFGMAVGQLHLQKFILLLFALSLACLIGCLVLFLADMRLSLRAVQEELGVAK
jgi:hypothetical protein